MPENTSRRILIVLVLLLALAYATKNIASASGSTAGFPLIASSAVAFAAGLMCMYIFSVSRKSFLLSKKSRIAILSSSFLLMGLLLLEIGIATILFKYDGIEKYLKLFDVLSLSSALILLSFFYERKSDKKEFNKCIAVVVLFFIVSSFFALSSFPYSAYVHKHVAAIGALVFISSGLIYMRRYSRTQNNVILYYVTGFMFLGIGLFNISVIRSFGDFTTWWGLFNIILGYVFFVAPLRKPEKSQEKALKLPKM